MRIGFPSGSDSSCPAPATRASRHRSAGHRIMVLDATMEHVLWILLNGLRCEIKHRTIGADYEESSTGHSNTRSIENASGTLLLDDARRSRRRGHQDRRAKDRRSDAQEPS